MKKYVSILLLFCLTSQFSHRIGVVAWFQIKQTEIIELFCINKEKPELACDGKCYLKQKLTESEKHTNEQSSNIPTSLKYEIIDYFLIEMQTSVNINYAQSILLSMDHNLITDNPYITKIFAPPRSN